MGLNINNERLARELAAATGETHDQALDVVGTAWKAPEMTEHDPYVFGRPSEHGEIGDVLGDQDSLVQRSQGEDDFVVQPGEGHRLRDGHGIDASVAQPASRAGRVHLVEQKSHQRCSGAEEVSALLPGK